MDEFIHELTFMNVNIEDIRIMVKTYYIIKIQKNTIY
jgi:hypothetical protein